MNNLIRKNIFDNKIQYNIILCIILSLGTAFRLFHFFYNRSLWMDEVYLSSSFSHLGYADLASKMLDYQQKAPLGFLWLVKLSVNLFGYHEMSLRLIPLLAGLLSLFLFASLCKYFLRPWAQLMALAIFAFAPALVYHSVEIKQYAMECLATVVALDLFIRYKDSHSWKDKICWGILGAITLWFSFSVIFVFAGIACGISLDYLIRKDWKSLLTNAVPFMLWLGSFLVNYLLFTHKHAESSWVVYFFKTYDNFMPFPPHSLQQLKWFPRNFNDLMDYPLGLSWNLKEVTSSTILQLISLPLVPALLLFTGFYHQFKLSKRSFYSLLFPVIFMLIASGIYLYPLLERFWVFISPVFILAIALGFEYFQQKLRSAAIAWALFIILISIPLAQSLYYLGQPQKFYKHKKSFEREGLVYISDNFRPGDAVYNYWNNAPGYKVYKNLNHLNYHAVEGHDFRKQSVSLAAYNQKLETELDQLKGSKRVWVIYNTQFLTDIGDLADDPGWYYKNKVSPESNLLSEFRKIGKPVKKWVKPDVSVYLFELY